MEELRLDGSEVTFDPSDIIVTKTDLSGKITYANDLFVRVSGYEEDELLGKPHSIIRHPAMPRAVFKLLWEKIESGDEIFAYVVNRCKNGDYYWVLAHVTPNVDSTGRAVGYHSSRRTANAEGLAVIKPLYAKLRAVEESSADRRTGLTRSYELLHKLVADAGFDRYERFVMSLLG